MEGMGDISRHFKTKYFKKRWDASFKYNVVIFPPFLLYPLFLEILHRPMIDRFRAASRF